MNSCCPSCNSTSIKKNGYTRHGKQNHRCLDCGRQFSLEPHIQNPYLDNSKEKQEASHIDFRVVD